MSQHEQNFERNGDRLSDEAPTRPSSDVPGRGPGLSGTSTDVDDITSPEKVAGSRNLSVSAPATRDPLFEKEPWSAVVGKSSEEQLAWILDDLGLSPDLDWEDLRVVAINVLGPVEVEGWLAPPERAIVTELACYLALHRERPISGEQLRSALRPDGREPTAKTMRTYLSMLRKALGPGYLPSRGNGYRFTFMVTCDWEGFNQLSSPDNELKRRLFALTLIRGRPFEGVPAGTYGWVFSELWVSQIEAAIVSAACAVGLECLGQGLLGKAEQAVRHGLLAVPHDLSLWKLRLQIATQQGATTLGGVRAEAAAVLEPDVLLGLSEELGS